MIKKCFTIISSLVFTATTGIICPLNTKAIEDIEPVEVVSMRSEYEKHYDNGDGTYTAYIDTVPLHYYENGEWLDIDNTLMQDENGNYVNRSNSMKVTLSPETSISPINIINGASNDNNQMVSVDYNGYSLSWSLIDTEIADDKPVIKDEPIVMSENVTDIEAENPEIADIQTDIADDEIESVVSYEKVYPVSEVSINEQESVERDIGMNKLNAKISESVSNLNSSVSYNNICEAVDCKVDIQSNSVKETLILENPDNLLEEYSYFIQSDRLVAELYEDNSVVFSDGDENVFIIPAPFMFDSSEYSDNNYDIKVTLEEYDNGYIYTLSPDMDWLTDEARIYPVMIDPYVIPDDTASIICRYNSEANPNSIYSGIKIGGKAGDRYETYISLQNKYFDKYPSNIIITEATFFMKMKATEVAYPESTNTYDLYGLTTNVPYIFYNDINKDKASYCKSVGIIHKTPATCDYGWSVDITKLANAWYNYAYSGNTSKGIPQYGFKIVARPNTDTVEGYGTTASMGSDRPYFWFRYEYSDNYYLPYIPSRYEDTSDIENFQSYMNCYAYVLQIYSTDADGSNLHPGEFGIPYNKNCNNYSELVQSYSTVSGVTVEFMDFLEERMKEDAKALNISLKSHKLQGSQSTFELSADYDESKERFIAMVIGSSFWGIRDYHYYARSGNGTCPNGHGGTCSGWTHQNGNKGKIMNTRLPYDSTDTTVEYLCDKNIEAYADSGIYSKSPEVRYYRITKDTDIYNSYYYGHGTDSSGTKFRINK